MVIRRSIVEGYMTLHTLYFLSKGTSSGLLYFNFAVAAVAHIFVTAIHLSIYIMSTNQEFKFVLLNLSLHAVHIHNCTFPIGATITTAT